MLRYSDDGLAARPAFFAPYNDLTVIVEDVGKENFYTVIVNNLLPGSVRITQVLGVGGKRQVLERLARRSEMQGEKIEFYLVDGDFDELLGRAPPHSAHLYRLKLYDIESYLLEEHALCVIAEEEHPRLTVDEYKELLQISSWKSEVISVSTRLVACIALLQEHEERQTGMSQSIDRYMGESRTLPDESEINSNIGQVRTAQSFVDAQAFDDLLQKMIERMGPSNDERLRWFSGKDILIPLAMRLLRHHTNRNIARESFCFRLAKHCAFLGLTELRTRLLAVAALIPDPSARQDSTQA